MRVLDRSYGDMVGMCYLVLHTSGQGFESLCAHSPDFVAQTRAQRDS